MHVLESWKMLTLNVVTEYSIGSY